MRLLGAVVALLGVAWAAPAPMDVDACVQVALNANAKVAEAEARVRQHRATLATVQAVYYPKLDALAWVAPMFTVRGGALEGVERDFAPDAWGPSTRLEALLSWPIYSFGRVEAAAEAAEARAAVEQARVREARNAVALEVRRLYYAHLYAKSLLPTLRVGAEALASAEAHARAAYDDATGQVTQADLMKLRYGALEIERLTRVAEDGAALALAALNHTMGRPADAPLILADDRLPDVDPTAAPPLARLYAEAAEHRPEWAQLRDGERATLRLEDAERLAMAPVLFAAGTITHSWTPTRDDADNPYHQDPYNDLFGGVAVGLQWHFDPLDATARAEHAAARRDEVQALARFAATGIPLQVKQAADALAQHAALAEIAGRQVKATRRWMTFSGAAWRTGTGDAREVLEGLVAYLQTRRTYYDHLRGWHVARAELIAALGHATWPFAP